MAKGCREDILKPWGMARTSLRQVLVRPEEAPTSLVSVKVGFWRRQFAGLPKVQWVLKKRATGHLRGRARDLGVDSVEVG